MDPADDDKLTTKDAEAIVHKMFLGGFFMLPWLWIVNFWFYREYLTARSDCTETIRLKARASCGMSFVWIFSVLLWYLVYQLNWESWGVAGEHVSLIVPKGQ